MEVSPGQLFGMQSWGKQGNSSQVYGPLTLSVCDRGPRALCGGCGCEHGLWRAIHEGHKQQLEQGTYDRAAGHWVRPWQRIVAKFEVVCGR